MRRIFVTLFLISCFGCKKERSDLDQVSNVRGGRCLLSKSSSDFLCLNFNTDYDANTASSTCQTEYNRYKTSHSVSGISSLSGNSNTCANGTSGTSIGSCTRSDGIIYYYSTHWSAGNAQTDCLSTHSGTWAQSLLAGLLSVPPIKCCTILI